MHTRGMAKVQRTFNPDVMRAAQARLGLTTDELARRVGRHPGTISSIRTGRQPPGRKLVKKLAEVLQLREELLWVQGDEVEPWPDRLAAKQEMWADDIARVLSRLDPFDTFIVWCYAKVAETGDPGGLYRDMIEVVEGIFGGAPPARLHTVAGPELEKDARRAEYVKIRAPRVARHARGLEVAGKSEEAIALWSEAGELYRLLGMADLAEDALAHVARLEGKLPSPASKKPRRPAKKKPRRKK